MTFGKLSTKVRKEKNEGIVKKKEEEKRVEREERKRKGKIEKKTGTFRKSILLLELE